MHTLVSTALNTIEQPDLARQQCEGDDGFSKLSGVLDLAHNTAHGMYDALVDVRDLFQCHKFNPIYTELVYIGETSQYIVIPVQ